MEMPGEVSGQEIYGMGMLGMLNKLELLERCSWRDTQGVEAGG